MKKFFQIAFWVVIVYSAMSVDNSTLDQICIEVIILVSLIFPAFYYEDLINYLNKPR